MKVTQLRVQYEDGSYVDIYRNQLDAVSALADTVDLMEQAERVFKMLEPLFRQEKKK